MGDFLRECNSGELKTDAKTFQDTWCARCSRKECDLAVFAKLDPMAHRQATWRERFFNPNRADVRLPKYATIAQQDFPNLLQKAMKIEISERRGDWSVPDVPVLDGVTQTAEPDHTDTVEAAVRALAGTHGKPPREVFEETVEEEDSEEVIESFEADSEEVEPDPEPAPAPPPRSPKKNLFRPPARNVPNQGGVMIGGAPRPETRPKPAPETDPWAAPAKPAVRVVKPGTRIQFGSGGKGEVVDD